MHFSVHFSPEHESKVSSGSVSAGLWPLNKIYLNKSHLQLGRKTLDIVASSIISTYDVYKT